MALLNIRNLTVKFATATGSFTAVDGIDVSVDKGEVLAIVGESGSGKSVSMLAVMGLLPDTALTRITDSAMKPRFRANDYAGGLNAAVDQIAARLAGDELPAVGASAGQQSAGAQDDGDGVFVAELFVVFFLAPFLGKRLLCNRLGRKKGVAITTGLMAAGSYLYSMDNVIVVLSSLMTMIVLLIITGKAGTGSGGGSSSSGGWVSSSDWSSGSSSSSSSGSSGFSSGGGGDFGGGGASDDW